MQDNANLFINRELSWLDFNRRVLALSKEKTLPLAERMKFAAIYASNLDEFFMVRVGSLYDRTLLKKEMAENKTGMTPAQQIAAILPKVQKLQEQCDRYLAKLYERLEKDANYSRLRFDSMAKEDERHWKHYFMNELYPVLSPQIIDRRHPFPFLRNQEVYLCARLKTKGEAGVSYGLIPIGSQFNRMLYKTVGGVTQYGFVEELILHFAEQVFPKGMVQSKCLFRVTRNADIDINEAMFDQDLDYREVMSELLKKRRKLAPVRLQFWNEAPQMIADYLCERLMLPIEQCFVQSSPLDLSCLFKITARLQAEGKAHLFYPTARPLPPPHGYNLQKAVQQKDVLIAYPYQSMQPFIDMLMQAAQDPDVVSIKMTLYRMAPDSQIVRALVAAAENGKEVVTIVELRARFDEENNISWSRRLEDAGCTVIYGLEDYKVHSKLTLITRKQNGTYHYTTQIGTGNYNEKTSEQYTDLSFVTAKQKIGEEAARVFNDLAMEQLVSDMDTLLVAPLCFKSVILREIDHEIEQAKQGNAGRIIIKNNSISDKDVILKLSEASCAGVCVQLIVRGICCMRVGVPQQSENLRVRSLVGRYLEHSRIYAFGQGESLRIYIASGDFLTRNTERRVEVGIRIDAQEIKDTLWSVLQLQLADNTNAREMQADASYTKVKPQQGNPTVNSQMELYEVFRKSFENDMPQEVPPTKRSGILRQFLGFLAKGD